jgi:flagellar M-ring protein FliF
VVVNDRVASGAAQKGKQAAWQPRTAEELRNLTALAQAAVGFDSSRGDVVSVQDLAFDENRTAAPPSGMSQALSMVEGSPLLLKYGAVLAGLLLMILLVIRPAVGKARQSVLAAKVKPGELAAPAQAMALPSLEQGALDAERVRTQQVFDQVTETLKRDPAQSSRLLQSWIHSD